MKLVVYFANKDMFVNIDADKIEQSNEFFCAYREGNLVGAFDVGCVTSIYLSGKKERE